MEKAKKSGNKILDGALIGVALGISAGLIAKSKFGKKMSKELKEKAEDFYKNLAPHLGELDKVLATKLASKKTGGVKKAPAKPKKK